MRARQANKIPDTERPMETGRHAPAFWYRYNRAWIYQNRISRKRLRKLRKKGHGILPAEEIDKLVASAACEKKKDGMKHKNDEPELQNNIRKWRQQKF